MLRFRGLQGLKELELRSNPISDDGLEILAGMHSLTTLNVHACTVSDAGLAHIAKLTNLERLDVGYSNRRITDAGATHLVNLTKLKWLCIYNSRITDKTVLEVISNLSSLQYVQLTDTDVTADGVAALKQALPSCHLDKPY